MLVKCQHRMWPKQLEDFQWVQVLAVDMQRTDMCETWFLMMPMYLMGYLKPQSFCQLDTEHAF